MRIIHKDLKKGEVKLVAENADDLWYLSHIIEPADKVRGRAERKLKLGKEGEKTKVERKRFQATIEVDRIEYSADALRLNGKIAEGPDDVPKGSYQAIEVDFHEPITVFKEQWLSYHLDRLQEAQKTGKPIILICVHDREEAIFALFKRNSYEVLTEISGTPQKKDDASKATGDFYADVIKLLEEHRKRHGLQHIILASPAFFKEDLMKRIKEPSLSRIITLATCSSVGRNAINEVLKREEVKQVLKEDRLTQESLLVDELLEEISRNGKAVYGKAEVQKAAEMGAVETLLVTDSTIHLTREEGTYDGLDRLMRLTEQNRGKVSIITAEHDSGKKLQGLGGVAALLRYRLAY